MCYCYMIVSMIWRPRELFGNVFNMKTRLLPYGTLALLLLSLDTPAFAYLDGATGSMLVQAIIGGVAAAGVYWRHSLARVKSVLIRMKGKGRADRDG
jgi:hypothetical protein